MEDGSATNVTRGNSGTRAERGRRNLIEEDGANDHVLRRSSEGVSNDTRRAIPSSVSAAEGPGTRVLVGRGGELGSDSGWRVGLEVGSE